MKAERERERDAPNEERFKARREKIRKKEMQLNSQE